MKVKSVSFYQSVKLGDGSQHNTVYAPNEESGDIRYKGVELTFKNGLMVVTGKDCAAWKAKGNNGKAYFVGITNIRGFECDLGELKGTPFESIIHAKPIKTEKNPEKEIIELSREEMIEFLKGKGVKVAHNIGAAKLEALYVEHNK